MDLNAAIDKLLAMLAESNGSDLFVTAGWPPSIKVDGVIRPAGRHPLSAEQAREMVRAVMNDHQRQEFEDTNECQFAIERPKLGRFRVSAFVQRDAAGMVLRRINHHHPHPRGAQAAPRPARPRHDQARDGDLRRRHGHR